MWSSKLLAQDTDAPLPIADAHVHYSHDSVKLTPPTRVIELMREAELKFALVSSSDDRGTQLLSALAPELIVPALRPYTRRGQLGSWYTNEENLRYVEKLLQAHRYAAIGELHISGPDADLPIPRRIVQLADEYNLIVHAHSDVDAIERLLAQNASIKVLWAHAGFDDPDVIAQMLEKHDRLWADLAFRSDVGFTGTLSENWRSLFIQYPDRLMLGTDTFSPERIYFIPEHAANARTWLASLPDDVAERVAWKNAYELIMPIWHANRTSGNSQVERSNSESADGGDHQQGHRAADTSVALHESAVNDEQSSMGTVPIGVDCGRNDAEFLLRDEALTVSIQPMANISVSEPFSVNLMICGAGAGNAEVKLDATMPAHGHGMNYLPQLKVLAQSDEGQQALVDGLVLHMPGSWQWQVDVHSENFRKTLKQDFLVQ